GGRARHPGQAAAAPGTGHGDPAARGTHPAPLGDGGAPPPPVAARGGPHARADQPELSEEPVAKKQKKNGGGTPATVALTAAGTPYTLHAYEHDPATASYGEEAAEALGVSPDRVFKTLVADVDGELTVAVVPVAGQLDL